MSQIRDKAYVGSLFVTLTYPDSYLDGYIDDWQRWKRDGATLIKRLRRRYPDARGIWRIELVTRKSGAYEGALAPHFHFIWWGVDLLDYWELVEFREWLARAWYEVVGTGDEKHLEAGTECAPCKSRQHSRAYVSKYIAKEEGDGLPIGRRWGWFGEIDTSPVVVTALTRPQAVELRRMVARWLKSTGRDFWGRRVARGKMGWYCFGLGDMSSMVWPDLSHATVMRMLGYVSEL
jgi:hypothetical protein